MNREQRRAQWRALCRKYREGTETQEEFCRRRGIAMSTLQYWLTKTRDEPSESSGNELVAVGVTERSESGATIRVRVDEWVTIEVDLPVEQAQLTEILRAARAV